MTETVAALGALSRHPTVGMSTHPTPPIVLKRHLSSPCFLSLSPPLTGTVSSRNNTSSVKPRDLERHTYARRGERCVLLMAASARPLSRGGGGAARGVRRVPGQVEGRQQRHLHLPLPRRRDGALPGTAGERQADDGVGGV